MSGSLEWGGAHHRDELCSLTGKQIVASFPWWVIASSPQFKPPYRFGERRAAAWGLHRGLKPNSWITAQLSQFGRAVASSFLALLSLLRLLCYDVQTHSPGVWRRFRKLHRSCRSWSRSCSKVQARGAAAALLYSSS